MQEFAPNYTSPPAPPTEHWPSDEDLAAFIDGTMEKAESRRIAEHLATCEECYAIYTGALEFKLESEPEAEVVPIPPREWDMRWVTAAAALLAVAVGSWYAFQNALLGPAPSLAVADLAPPVQGRPVAGLLWDHSVFRGAGEAETELDRQAIQIGALLVDFRLSAQAGDFETASEIWRTIGAVLKDMDFMADDGNQILTEANQIVDLASLRRTAATVETTEKKLGGESSVLSPEYLDFGKWTEAGRIAAETGNPAFFKSWKNRRFLAYVLRGKDIKPSTDTRPSLEKIARIWDKGDLGPADFKSLAQHFQSVLDEYEFRS